MKVFIRADASAQIGTGHVMRCLTLAGDLRQFGMEVSFISRVLPGDLCDYVERQGFKVYRLRKPAVGIGHDDYWAWLGDNWRQDAEETKVIILKEDNELDDIRNTLNGEGPFVNLQSEARPVNRGSKIAAQLFTETVPETRSAAHPNIVVDSYALDAKWEKQLKPHVNKIMVIDDLANRSHACDLLLDQNYYINMENRYDGLLPPHCQKLLGPEYALLRPEFHLAKRKMRKRDGKVRRILIFFGGSDPTNETVKALEAVKLLNRPETAVDVVVGAANPHKEQVKDICNQMPNTTYHCQVEKMAELMAAADLAIGAGGSTTWERLYLELPTIAIAVAENQVETLEALGKAGFLTYLGLYFQVSAPELARITLNILGD